MFYHQTKGNYVDDGVSFKSPYCGNYFTNFCVCQTHVVYFKKFAQSYMPVIFLKTWKKGSFWVPEKGKSTKNLSMDFVWIQRILGSQTVFWKTGP